MANSKGVCIWFTGRSGAGKSTITNALVPLLQACGCTITILDVVPLLAKTWCERTSEGKLLRKGLVAKEIVRHGGVAICVTVSARRETREAVRELVGPDNFVEVFVDVPPELSAARKAARKQKARPVAKQIKFFLRRISKLLPFRQPVSYEPPFSPELTLDTTRLSPAESAQAIFQLLLDRGVVTSNGAQPASQPCIEIAGAPAVTGQLSRDATGSKFSRPVFQEQASQENHK